ncbi:hypothetical protein CPB85DRAFT_1254259 [Mucidula mucida]|nr:hypothetical protein CPB85DRAFT_1254259 [Mucidula mucida]
MSAGAAAANTRFSLVSLHPPCPLLNTRRRRRRQMHSSGSKGIEDDAAIVTAREALKDVAFGSIVQAAIAPNSFPRAHLSTLISNGSRAEVEVYRKRLPGPFAIIKTTIQDHGVRGLWLGHTGTILRETGGTASWFAVKEYLASSLKSRRLGEGIPGELLPWESAVSGALRILPVAQMVTRDGNKGRLHLALSIHYARERRVRQRLSP